jgi:hypothetical protein
VASPEAPDLTTRERLLGVLADFISRGGAERFLAAPVVPGSQMFPDPWAASKSGVMLLLRRLAAHAGFESAITIDDRRHGAPPTERKPATRVELVSVDKPGEGPARRNAAGGAKVNDKTTATFAMGFIGSDDVVGTLAHEIGVAFAVVNRSAKGLPYRIQEADVLEPGEDDAERGSIATVYLGLGVVAANAAYQHYSWAGRFNGAYEPLEVEVLRAGHVSMSDLAYLLAVRAIVCGESAPPAGLEPPQRDEVAAWIRASRADRSELCTRLGVADTARATPRAAVTAFEDVELADENDYVVKKTAFRWQTHRGGVGLIAGTVFGLSIAVLIATRGASPAFAFGGAAGGHIVGRRVRVPRCSACASVVCAGAPQCAQCGAVLRGDISSLSERLDAEERLDAADSEKANLD